MRWLFLIFILMSNQLWSQQNWTIQQDSVAIKNKKHYLNSIKKTAGKEPNIILIVADDLGKHDLSVYGNLIIQTPNIDILAKEGAIFTDGYATAPICAPSRAGMLTGRYQQRFGFQMQPQQRFPKSRFEWWAFKNLMNTNDIEPQPYQNYPNKTDIQKQGLPPSEITIAEILKSAGYKTAWFGKWHLGYYEPLLPANFGFDEQFGCLEAFTLYADPKNKNIVNAKINEFTDKHIWKKGRSGACAIRKNGIEINEEMYLTYAFEREARSFISKNKDEPFFIYMPVNAPHTPYQAPKEIYDSLTWIQDHNKRVYYSMIIALDKMVGNIVEHLEKENLLDNTLIIFTSDNGAALYSRTVTNEPMTGGKFTFYEGGINVPLMIYQKNKIKPQTVIKEPVMLFDLYTTIADVAKIKTTDDRIIDGKSLLPWLYNGSAETIHEQLYWYSDYNRAMRRGNWKIIINTKDQNVELYELTGVKTENNNLVSLQVDLSNNMALELNKWISALPKMLWPGLVEYELIVNGKVTHWSV